MRRMRESKGNTIVMTNEVINRRCHYMKEGQSGPEVRKSL